jgi:cytoskeleton protein RodZ
LESFGARLKREREQRKVTLDDISLSTKIGTRFLRALEEEHFEQLPGGIFNKGFVRAYARHLGMDEEQTISDYLVASGAAQPEKMLEEAPQLELPPAEPEPPVAARIPWGMLAVALLLVALGFALWGFRSREKPVIPAVVTAPADNKPSSPAPATPAIPKLAAPESSAAVAANARATPAQPPAAAAVNQGPAPGAFVVSITARENSWLTITADGKQIMNEILVAPGEKSVEGQKEVVIRAGDVGALEFSFNGKKLPIQGDYDEVKTLVFDANGLRSSPTRTDSSTVPPPQS